MHHSAPLPRDFGPITIIEGGEVLITPELMLQLQLPRNKPPKALPFVVVLKQARVRKYGPNRFFIPAAKLESGFALFVSDGLRLGHYAKIVWYDRKKRCAALVAEDMIPEKSIFDQDRRGDDFVSA